MQRILFVFCLAYACQAMAVESARVFHFPPNGITFDASFEGARLNDCVLCDDGKFRILIRPENRPINDSAWYAFRVSAETQQTLTIQMVYEGGKHRYHPKLSMDGRNWQRLTGDRYQHKNDHVTLRVDVGPKPVWIASQEMIGITELNAWIDEIAKRPFVEESVVGRSVGNRPLRQLTIGMGRP